MNLLPTMLTCIFNYSFGRTFFYGREVYLDNQFAHSLYSNSLDV